MRSRTPQFIAALAWIGVVGLTLGATPSEMPGAGVPSDEQIIVACERDWAESVASGDPSAVERCLADDFIGVDPKGRTYDKATMIADTRNGPKYFVSNHLNEVKGLVPHPQVRAWVDHQASELRAGKFRATE